MKRVVLLLVALVALFSFMGAIAFAAQGARATLTAQNGSGQNGTAQLTDLGDGTTKVVVDISSSTADAQPIHIHNGTCDTLDPKPKYPLTTMVNGKSETIVNVSVSDLLAAPFAINVHKSGTEASVYVACGNIVAVDVTQPGMPTTGNGNGSQNMIFSALAIVALGMTIFGLRLVRRKA
jgi:hypothetical protein